MIACQCIYVTDIRNWAQPGLSVIAGAKVHYNAALRGCGSVAAAQHHVV